MNIEYQRGDIVYLKTDVDQLPRIVVGIVLIGNIPEYILRQGAFESQHFGFEIISEKNILITSSN